ncbi:uncharacterized protein N0V89_001120 [Didymosphaeria variabile]|uniref:Defect at low temperature protein 1 n=1 Tax=Didymosphaeria variabile TaxID=1932322 RepID=A0A9W8XXT9_9PLEO|nr:uncharacterized protein N0V89_001120 [Didymosphaeria variabile]KAJ4360555.1 hypothetical protein N0V89_001120 [Didymosphaeria variabile]
MRIPTLFRIWYSTTYTVIFGILLVLLAVTPAETVYQSIRSDELQKIFVIGGVYLLTVLIILLIYSTRLYTNRSVLQAIPKPYIPIEDGEVGKLVRRMIVKKLRRSAVVAWDSMPRDARGEAGDEDRHGTASVHHKRRHAFPATVIPVNPDLPPWGHVSHPGWASPASPDLPNLQYNNVVNELPNLIEAKAVSLAPPDPALEDRALRIQDTPMLPDAQIVALLQRPRTMGLRDYLARLSSFGLLNPPSLGPRFLSLYEYARFSTKCLTEVEFRGIMAVFTEILNGMTELNPAVMDEARAASSDAETRSLAPTVSSYTSHTSSRTGLPYRTPMVDNRSEFSFDENPSPGSPQTVQTAPSMIRTMSGGAFAQPRTPSIRSAVSDEGSVRRRTVQRSPSTLLPNSSTSSLRSAGSVVVRLNPSPEAGDLPYQYQYEDG